MSQDSSPKRQATETGVSLDFSFPAEHKKFLWGKKGKKIKQLKQNFHVEISPVAGKTTSSTLCFTMSGEELQVEQGLAQFAQRLLAKGVDLVVDRPPPPVVEEEPAPVITETVTKAPPPPPEEDTEPPVTASEDFTESTEQAAPLESQPQRQTPPPPQKEQSDEFFSPETTNEPADVTLVPSIENDAPEPEPQLSAGTVSDSFVSPPLYPTDSTNYPRLSTIESAEDPIIPVAPEEPPQIADSAETEEKDESTGTAPPKVEIGNDHTTFHTELDTSIPDPPPPTSLAANAPTKKNEFRMKEVFQPDDYIVMEPNQKVETLESSQDTSEPIQEESDIPVAIIEPESESNVIDRYFDEAVDSTEPPTSANDDSVPKSSAGSEEVNEIPETRSQPTKEPDVDMMMMSETKTTRVEIADELVDSRTTTTMETKSSSNLIHVAGVACVLGICGFFAYQYFSRQKRRK